MIYMNLIRKITSKFSNAKKPVEVYTENEVVDDDVDDYYEVAVSTTGAPTGGHIHRRWENFKPVRKTFGKR